MLGPRSMSLPTTMIAPRSVDPEGWWSRRKYVFFRAPDVDLQSANRIGDAARRRSKALRPDRFAAGGAGLGGLGASACLPGISKRANRRRVLDLQATYLEAGRSFRHQCSAPVSARCPSYWATCRPWSTSAAVLQTGYPRSSPQTDSGLPRKGLPPSANSSRRTPRASVSSATTPSAHSGTCAR